MSDTEFENEISFTIKFLGRVEVVRLEGMQVMMDALGSLQNPNNEESTKTKTKKSKAHLFLSRSTLDILEHKTKFMLYTCPLSSVAFCAVHKTQPKIFGFVAKHPAAAMFHCYMFQSKTFSHLLVSLIGEAFQACRMPESVRGGRDLMVEALRHKNKVLQRENGLLKRRLKQLAEGTAPTAMDEDDSETQGPHSPSEKSNSQVRFHTDRDTNPLLRST